MRVPSDLKKIFTDEKLVFIALCCTMLLGCAPQQQPVERNLMVLNFDTVGQVINENIYGHFAEHLGRGIYEGIWVGPESEIPNYRGYRLDVLQALRELQIPVLRWPGGCFADTYNWKNGIGPRNQRPAMINAFWGGVVENNHFGTHEFLDLCEILGIEPYVNINVGSGSVREMMEWLEYMNSDLTGPMADLRRANGREEPWNVRYIGIGNENWGCGGEMRPEYFADLYRKFSVYARQFGGPDIIRIAGGGYGAYYDWTDVVMESAAEHMEAISIHYYTLPTGDWVDKSPATGFCDSLYFSALRNALMMDTHITRHIEIMDEHDPDGRIGLHIAEWGVWTNPEPGSIPGFLFQQNTMRDALIASLHFDIFHNHADRVRMANIAQMINVLQAMILTDGPRMLLTPTYHVFNMYKVHQNATHIPATIQSELFSFKDESFPAITGTASIKDGKVNIGVSNLHATQTIELDVDVSGGNLSKILNATILTAPAFNSYNTWDNPNIVTPQPFTAYTLVDGKITLTMPPYSIVSFQME